MKYSRLLFVITILLLPFMAINAHSLGGDKCPSPNIITYLPDIKKTIGIDNLQFRWSTQLKVILPINFVSADFFPQPPTWLNGSLRCNYIDGYGRIFSLYFNNNYYKNDMHIEYYHDLWRSHVIPLDYFHGYYFFSCTSPYISSCPFDINNE